MSRRRAFQLASGILIGVFLLLIPLILPEIRIHLAIEALIYSLFAISFNVLFGYGGMLPFGHGGLFGAGAYATALMIRYFPATPLSLILLATALFGLLVALFIGFFCVRLKGPSFSLCSLAFQMFLFAVALKWRTVTSGDDGMGITRPALHLPLLGEISMRSVPHVYYFTLFVVALAIFCCYLFLKTPLGNSIVCIREREMRASFLGYNVFITKLSAFVVSGILAGLAGGLFALFQEFVGTSFIDLNMGMSVVIMTVIGGQAHFLGPVLGAAFYVVLQDWLSSLTSYWMIVMGILFVTIVMYLEGGLIGLAEKARMRLWAGGPEKAGQ